MGRYAFWIKPYVAVPALLVWFVAARLAYRAGVPVRSLSRDAAVVLAGGLVAGVIGLAWLIGSGAWPYFVEMATVWNPEYFQYDVTGGERRKLLLGFLVRFFPWLFIHLAAVPVALRQLVRADRSAALLAAFYLGWLFQSALLQHMFDYVQLPAVLLGVAVVVGHVSRGPSPVPRRLFATFLVVCVLVRVPLLVERLDVWPRCWREGSSPQLRDRLSVLHKLNWPELQRTANYLRAREAASGEVTCVNMPAAALYRELDIEASTRYHFLQNNWLSFRRQRPRILRDLAASRRRASWSWI